MKLLAVVTPPSIYHGWSTRKTLWEEKFTGKEMFFCLRTWNIVVVAKLGNTMRSRVVTSTSHWTSHQNLTVWTGWKPHLQIQKENWKDQEKGWLPLWFSVPKQSRKNKKRQGMTSEMSARRTFRRLLRILRKLRNYLMGRRGPNMSLLTATFI